MSSAISLPVIGAGLLAPVIGLSVTSYLTGALLIALAITTFFVVRKSGNRVMFNGDWILWIPAN